MRVAGLVVGRTLELLRSSVRPGITTGELDAIAEDNIRSSGAIPSFKGYGHPPFPASICASVNDEVVHGIPGIAYPQARRRHLHRLWGDRRRMARRRRDHRGRGGDQARGARADESHRGVDVAGLRRRQARRPGHRHLPCRRDLHPQPGRLRDPRGVRRARHRHRDAPAPERAELRAPRSWPEAGAGACPRRRADGGDRQSGDLRHGRRLDIATIDRNWSAHFEHTFTLTENGPWILTALDGGEQKLTEMGLPFGGR